ncbi:helix-turn-helix domain-containing protein [Actinoalloteichus caeruleus]|uniref:helix-turn-helix domain-containing protein n=1 Tax=Actinoalloteichus cyanogriseus TaxID=2893586 RepID=UPI003AABB058
MVEHRMGLARARKAAGYTQESLGEALGVHWTTVRRWEAGKQNVQPHRRVKLAQLLGVDLGQLDNLLHAGTTALPVAVGSDVPASQGFMPSISTGSAVVDSVRATSRHLIGLDVSLGSRAIADLATMAANSANHRMMREPLDSRTERDLRAAVAELFEVAGWVAYDGERQNEAREMNEKALVLSSLAGDRKMENLVKLNMSMQSNHVGRYGEAIAVAQSIIDSKVSSRVHAMCLIRQARAYSKLEERMAIKLIAQARSYFLDGVSDHDPEWAWWIDGLELEGQYACALIDLGQPGDAAPILYEVVHAVDRSVQPKYRIIWWVRLLEALMKIEQWEDAEKALRRLYDDSGNIGSTRAINSLLGETRRIASIGSSKIPSAIRDMSELINAKFA